MSVVVADLVARISAQGVQETRSQVQAVGEEAARTARALEIMAEKAAKMGGGSAAGWLENFQRSGAQPTAAALAQAAAEAEKTAAAIDKTGAAAQRAVAPTQTYGRALVEHVERTARGGDAMAKSFDVSGSNLLRVAGALTGVGLGLNIAAGAAAQLHAEIAASAQAAVEADRAARGLAGTYGTGAPGMASYARGLAPGANLTVGATERALTAAGPLTNQFGLSQAQIQQASGRAVDLAARYGQPSENTLSATFDAIQNGGSQLQQYNVRLDDTYIKTIAWNGALAKTYDNMTQAQQAAVRFNAFLEQTKTVQGSAATAADTLSGSIDHLGAAFARLRESSGVAASGGIVGPATALSNWIDSLTGGSPAGAQRRAIVADPNAPAGARIISGTPQFDLSGVTPLASNTPPSFIGPIPLRASDLLTDLDRLQAPAASLAAAAQAGIPNIGLAGGSQLAELARRRAESSMLANQVAQRNTANNLGLEGQLGVALGQATNDSERNRLSEQLTTLKEYQTVTRSIVDAEHDQAAAQRDIAIAQSSLTEVAIRQRERETTTALRLLDVRRQDLQAQQTVQRLGVDVTRAQLGAQPALNAAQDLGYADQRTILQAQVRQSRLLRGMDVSDLPSFDQLIGQHVSNALAQPEVALGALDATRGVDLAQRGVTAASLTERLAAAPLGAADIGLQLKNLDDLPTQTKALEDLYAGQREQLAAERASRDALVSLAGLAGKQSTTGGGANVPVTITINGGSADTVDIVKKEIADFEQRLRGALSESDRSQPPQSSELAGARR